MDQLLLAFLFVLNFAVSWWNAYACGKSWAESKAAGGWRRFMCWMAAIMSGTGFTWCYLMFFTVTAFYFHILTAGQLKIAIELGYIIIIPGLLFAGLMITIDSWAQAFRRGGVLDYGVATYNTYAQIHNTVSAIDSLGGAFADVFSFFGGSESSSDDDNFAGLVIIGLCAMALGAGVITTTVIIKKTAGSEPLPSMSDLREHQHLSQTK